VGGRACLRCSQLNSAYVWAPNLLKLPMRMAQCSWRFGGSVATHADFFLEAAFLGAASFLAAAPFLGAASSLAAARTGVGGAFFAVFFLAGPVLVGATFWVGDFCCFVTSAACLVVGDAFFLVAGFFVLRAFAAGFSALGLASCNARRGLGASELSAPDEALQGGEVDNVGGSFRSRRLTCVAKETAKERRQAAHDMMF
jgi:hypothetical protein